MNIKLIWWIFGGLFVVIVVGVIWFYVAVPNTPAASNQQNPVTLPSSGSVAPVTNPSNTTQGGKGMPLTTQAGTIVVKDFIHNKVTVPDPSNKGNFFVAGKLPVGFSIGYSEAGQFFTIALEQEPLGDTRITAENFLLSTLGITKAQMCQLNYYLGTDIHTNSFYGGKNLGFSFCPGAVVLPTK